MRKYIILGWLGLNLALTTGCKKQESQTETPAVAKSVVQGENSDSVAYDTCGIFDFFCDDDDYYYDDDDYYYYSPLTVYISGCTVTEGETLNISATSNRGEVDIEFQNRIYYTSSLRYGPVSLDDDGEYVYATAWDGYEYVEDYCRIRVNPSVYTDSRIFNINEYREFNSDIRNMREADARVHWITNGLPEGRVANAMFVPTEYMKLHEDLRATFGATNYKRGALHYLQFGHGEGRGSRYALSPLIFNADEYRNFNSDIANMDDTALRRHWVYSGVGEGRRASYNFSPKDYLNKYPGIRPQYNTYMQAITHYIEYGQNEGKSAAYEGTQNPPSNEAKKCVAVLDSNGAKSESTATSASECLSYCGGKGSWTADQRASYNLCWYDKAFVFAGKPVGQTCVATTDHNGGRAAPVTKETASQCLDHCRGIGNFSVQQREQWNLCWYGDKFIFDTPGSQEGFTCVAMINHGVEAPPVKVSSAEACRAVCRSKGNWTLQQRQDWDLCWFNDGFIREPK